jgi:hypothetical protein
LKHVGQREIELVGGIVGVSAPHATLVALAVSIV